nr:MAG TPA: hypothetical protein [Caudoviricetes sp.]
MFSFNDKCHLNFHCFFTPYLLYSKQALPCQI